VARRTRSRASSGWGWYRLHPRAADRLVAASGVGPRDLVLDVGAGDGALTAPLLATGARVVAVELHPGRAVSLRERFADAVDDGQLRVVRADARDLRLPRRPFRVVANPPWSITDALVARLVHPGSRLERADLLLKRAATTRWAASRALGFSFEASAKVPRTDFRPAPPIDGRVLRIERRRPSTSPNRSGRSGSATMRHG
jgi:23S rRNA (adenine-N6)-dimethyltransferase